MPCGWRGVAVCPLKEVKVELVLKEEERVL
jgi:hypothetical protein